MTLYIYIYTQWVEVSFLIGGEKKLCVDVGTRNHRMAEIHKVVPQFGIAKLVNITPIKPMVYGRYNELVNGG